MIESRGNPGPSQAQADLVRTNYGRFTTYRLLPIASYHRGDCTNVICRPAIIAHVCNDVGQWGAGFVRALSARWPHPEREYYRWFNRLTSQPFALGETQLVATSQASVWVANMLAQRGIGGRDGRHQRTRRIQYDALERCLRSVAALATSLRASVHMPRIGCGLGGGDWSRVERLIDRTLLRAGVQVHVYDPN